jgi:putative hydrolase of the HAD superfamily
MTPRGLLLDAMGTLIGLRSSVGATYAELAARHGLTVDAAAIDRHFPRIYKQAPPLAFPDLASPALDSPALEEAEIGWWSARIAEVLAAAGAEGEGAGEGEGVGAGVESEPPPELGRALFRRFAQADLWRVYDDVPAHLEAWHRRGLRLAVVSNFDSRLPGLLDSLGLGQWLEAVVVSSAVGAAKPDPRPYQQALAQLNLTAAEVWHVGDSPEDGTGAHAAGIRWVKVQRP